MLKQQSVKWALLAFCLLLAAGQCLAQDPYMGEYEGTCTPDKASPTLKATANVIAEGPQYYRVAFTVEPGKNGMSGFSAEVYGVAQGASVGLFGRSGSVNWGGYIGGDKIVLNNNYYGMSLELTKKARKSPTEGLKPPKNAVVLLPYEPGKAPDLSAWAGGPWKANPDGTMMVEAGKGNVKTKQPFADVKLHLEFKLPFEPTHFGQERCNSGVFFCGLYETQVLDSFGLILSMGDCGSVYDQARPLVNASLPPETWQTYDITFRAARMKNGKTDEQPRITTEFNGIQIHKNQVINGSTLTDKPGSIPDVERGPLELQDHGHPVQYRNIWVVELKNAKP